MNTANDRPDLRPTVAVIDEWCEENPTLSAIDPLRLAKEVHLPAKALTDALFFLVGKGVLEQGYKVMDAEGLMMPGFFASFEEIPNEFLDRFGDSIVSRSETTIVPVFR